MSEANEPPPDVAKLAPEHREIWYAACRLLEENADLIALAVDSDIGDDGWQNSDMEQEHISRKAREAHEQPLSSCPLLCRRGAPSEDRRTVRLSLRRFIPSKGELLSGCRAARR